MRLSSVVILIALVGGAAYVVFYTDLLQKGQERLEGFHDATSPQEAMDLFREAIRKRKYETAARYVTKDYAEQLKRAHIAASEMGSVIDSIWGYMDKSGFKPAKAITVLALLDPFPTWFKVKEAPKESNGKAVGAYVVELPSQYNPASVVNEGHGWDKRMLTNPLIPVGFPRVPLVKEGDVWKLDVKVPPQQVQLIGHYIDNYRSYHTALSTFRRDATNQRYETKEKFGSELLEVIRASATK
jgi:hypothetical protein